MIKYVMKFHFACNYEFHTIPCLKNVSLGSISFYDDSHIRKNSLINFIIFTISFVMQYGFVVYIIDV